MGLRLCSGVVSNVVVWLLVYEHRILIKCQQTINQIKLGDFALAGVGV